MCHLRNIATLRDYQESVTTGQTHTRMDGRTDRRGQSDSYEPLCFAGDTKMYLGWKLISHSSLFIIVLINLIFHSLTMIHRELFIFYILRWSWLTFAINVRDVLTYCVDLDLCQWCVVWDVRRSLIAVRVTFGLRLLFCLTSSPP